MLDTVNEMIDGMIDKVSNFCHTKSINGKRKEDGLNWKIEQNDLEEILNKCSTSMIQCDIVTNHDLCALLAPLHEEIVEGGWKEEIVTPEFIDKIKSTLLKVDEAFQNSCNWNACGNGYSLSNPDFIKPISARQASRAEAVLSLLDDKKIGWAVHELYDMIDDFGYQYKKWHGKYKTISCNEAVLYHLVITQFIRAIR